jgi:hypothetical protein
MPRKSMPTHGREIPRRARPAARIALIPANAHLRFCMLDIVSLCGTKYMGLPPARKYF